jgi:hypothetical protein
MTRKIILLLITVLILSLLIQLYYTSSDVIEFYNNVGTSTEFNNLVSATNVNQDQITNEQLVTIYNEYIASTDIETQHTENLQNLYDTFLLHEQNSINNSLTDNDTDILIYLTKPPPIENSDSYNLAGEFIRTIDGNVCVWQPLSFWMFGPNLQTVISSNNKPYIECWVRESIRSGSSSMILDEPTRAKFAETRPSQSSIEAYLNGVPPVRVNDVNELYYFNEGGVEKLAVGDKKVTFLGHKKDSRRRIFDQPIPSSGIRNIPEGKFYSWMTKGDYDDNKDKSYYKRFVMESVNWLNDNVNNPKCFGLQWKNGELFWSEKQDRCDMINSLPRISMGWPNGWALDYYKIEDLNINNITYDYSASADISPEEAKNRREKITRNNNGTLKLKTDLP